MRALVAMSGGVDSSAAALIAAQTLGKNNAWGVHMLLNDEIETCDIKSRSCCSSKDARDAQSVAQSIGIFFDELPMQNVFRRLVVEKFISEWRAGRTPVPCTLCNAYLKFDLLFKYASAAGFDTVVTGHYIRQNESGRLFATNKKDQSYYLWPIKTNDLSRIWFPIGNFDSKESVRQLLRDNNISLAEKTESQNICFIKSDYREFLAQHPDFQDREGYYVLNNKQIGTHTGYWKHTIGQRASTSPSRTYVTGIDVDTNTVFVSETIQDTRRSVFTISDTNWHGSKTNLLVKTNSLGKLFPCEINDNKVTVNQPILATPGQAAVFYTQTEEGCMLVGGGWIN